MVISDASNPSRDFALLDAVAEEAIGDHDRALIWLHTPNMMLGGGTPLEEVAKPTGRRRVAQLLGQIAYGGLV